MSNPRVKAWVRPEVQAMQAYRVEPAAGFIKLDAMENPYSLPAEIAEQLAQRLCVVELNRYPDPGAHALKPVLRAYLRIPRHAEVMLGNGSDELIQIVALALSGFNRVLLAPEPSFTMYPVVAATAGMTYTGVALRPDDFRVDAEVVLSAIEQHAPAIVFLASPNNPTGNLLERPVLEAILAAAPGLVVVDEAYYPFAGVSMLDALERHENLLILQTLSKLGLAGLRLGILAGAADWLRQFEKIRMPYNINVLSQVAAAFILEEHGAVLAEQTRRIREERDRLFEAMHRDPRVRVWPSQANFLLFRCRDVAAAKVHHRLRDAGVLIKCLDGVHPLLGNCLRVSVGTTQENRKFMEALDDALRPG
jgi:histidinol-phosphate aminotransferase